MPIQTAIPQFPYLDKQETIAFYTNMLGFTFHSEWEGYLIFSLDAVELHFWFCKDPEVPKNSGAYFRVQDIDKIYRQWVPGVKVHPNGGALETKPWGMRQFSILDNSGNILHFGEEENA